MPDGQGGCPDVDLTTLIVEATSRTSKSCVKGHPVRVRAFVRLLARVRSWDLSAREVAVAALQRQRWPHQ